MMNCKLPLGTGVYCNTSEESRKVVSYLLECNIPNPHSLTGTDAKQHYGLAHNNRIRMYSGDFENHITFAEFEQLISEPSEPVVINTYNLY